MSKLILKYLSEVDINHDYKKQISDLWKEKKDQTSNLVGVKSSPKSNTPIYKSAPKATPESEARRGAFDNDPDQTKKSLDTPSPEEEFELQKKKAKEWEEWSPTQHPYQTAAVAATGLGAYLLYKHQKRKDTKEKEKVDEIDPKFKKEDIKKKLN